MSKNAITLEMWLQTARKATLKTNPAAPEQIAGKVLKISRSEIAAKSKDTYLSPKQRSKLDNLLGKLLAGRPLAAVLHHTQFYNVNLKVNNRVLSPRAETEALVQYAVENIPKGSKVFDIGTGTGAIGLGLAKARPDLQITLTDLSNKTLSLAKLNSRKNRITNTNFIKSNLIKKIDQTSLDNSYLIANLPYVNRNWPGVKLSRLKHEPHSALFASDNGLQIIKNFLNQIINKKVLCSDNWILLEHDPKQYKDLENFCKRLSLTTKEITGFITLVKLT